MEILPVSGMQGDRDTDYNSVEPQIGTTHLFSIFWGYSPTFWSCNRKQTREILRETWIWKAVLGACLPFSSSLVWVFHWIFHQMLYFSQRLLWSCLTGTICPEVYQDLGKLCQRLCPQVHSRGMWDVALHKPLMLPCTVQRQVSSALREQGKSTALSAFLVQFWFYLLSSHQTPALCLCINRL